VHLQNFLTAQSLATVFCNCRFEALEALPYAAPGTEFFYLCNRFRNGF
jgi:hypothetical protein